MHTKVSFLFLTQKLGSKTTLWQAYGATTHCHQDKPDLLAFASLGWQQTSSWLALAARGKPERQESGLGMRLQWSGNEAAMVQQWGYSGLGMMLQWSWNDAAMVLEWGCNGPAMRLQWPGNDAAMVLEWGCNGLGMRLQWSSNEATVVWKWCYLVLEWGYSSLGMRPLLQEQGYSGLRMRLLYSLPCSVLLPQHSWGPKDTLPLLHRPQLIPCKW